MSDEGFDSYGLKLIITADYSHDNGRSVQYASEAVDPSIDVLAEMFVELVESCFGWGIARELVISRLREALNEVET